MHVQQSLCVFAASFSPHLQGLQAAQRRAQRAVQGLGVARRQRLRVCVCVYVCEYERRLEVSDSLNACACIACAWSHGGPAPHTHLAPHARRAQVPQARERPEARECGNGQRAAVGHVQRGEGGLRVCVCGGAGGWALGLRCGVRWGTGKPGWGG